MNLNNLLNETKDKIEIVYKITKIKDNGNYIVLYLNNEEKYKISIETYFKYQKYNGLDLNGYQFVIKEDKYISAYNSCLRKLSIKDFSVKQISNFLVSKFNLDDDEINRIVNKLMDYGLLDDIRYCQNRISYFNNNLYSYKSIKNKLILEGIEENVINDYLKYSYDYELDKAKDLVLKFDQKIKNKSSNSKKQSILSKLVSLGYSYEIAKNALNCININSVNDVDLLNREYLKALKKFERKYENYELKNHIVNYLLSKGFSYDDIKDVMEVQNAS